LSPHVIEKEESFLLGAKEVSIESEVKRGEAEEGTIGL